MHNSVARVISSADGSSDHSSGVGVAVCSYLPLKPANLKASIDSALQSLNRSIGGAQKGGEPNPPPKIRFGGPAGDRAEKPKSPTFCFIMSVHGAGHPQLLAIVSSRHFLSDSIGTSQHI